MTDLSSRSPAISDDPDRELGRRGFLRGACAAGGLAALGIGGCTVPVRSVPVVFGGVVEIPLARFPELARPGGIVRVEDRRSPRALHVRCNEDGSHEAISAVCTHQGCLVRPSGSGFRCPCHGSSYDSNGENLTGPARRPLRRFEAVRDRDVIVLRLR